MGIDCSWQCNDITIVLFPKKNNRFTQYRRGQLKGVILAAGIASRLRPLTNDKPKCLLKIGSKTILERTLTNLLKNDITDVILVTGYLAEKIHTFINNKFPQLNIQFLHNDIYDSTNNIYTLWMTKDYVLSDDIILLDSDIIFDSRIIELLLASGYQDCLALRSKGNLGKEDMKVKVNNNKEIVEISKDIDLPEAQGESIGIEKFSRPFLADLFTILDRKMLRENRVNEFYETAFQEAIEGNNKLYALDVGDYRCIEIDTHGDIKEAGEEVIPYLK
jgi:choline kinase